MADLEIHDPARQSLMQELNEVLPSTFELPPVVWAVLWLSDIEMLKRQVDKIKAEPAERFLLYGGGKSTLDCVLKWMQRKRLSSTSATPVRPSTPLQPLNPVQPLEISTLVQSTISSQLPSFGPQSSAPESSAVQGSGKKRNSAGQLIPRSKVTRDKCHQRDNKKCVLTKMGEPNEVAHIFPFSMRYEDTNSSFWVMLNLFWSKDRVDAWYNAVFPCGTKVCQNLISLTPSAHAYWTLAYFALKPVSLSDDRKRLEIQFFWLNKSQFSVEPSLVQRPEIISGQVNRGPEGAALINSLSDRSLCSGDTIILETDDPVSRPLPDFKILEMQWFLHRLAAMSGASELREDGLSTTDSEEAIIMPDQWGNWDYDYEIEVDESGEMVGPFTYHGEAGWATPRAEKSSGNVVPFIVSNNDMDICATN